MEIQQLIIASLLGLLAGTITGLIPGLHNNLVTSVLVSVFSLKINLAIAAFVVSLALAHVILDFIPTVYLGVADDTVLSILPGHELLLAGKGEEAIKLLLRGASYALAASPIFIVFFLFFAKTIQTALSRIIPVLLVGLIVFLLAKEEKTKKAIALFTLTGFLGYATLHLPVKEPLTPLLTGLFGLSGIILSLSNKVSLPKQEKANEKISKEDTKKSIIPSLIVSPIFSFLPALGSGYAALFGSEIVAQSRKSFLMLNGFLNVQVMILSFILIAVIEKARTGAAAAIKPIFQTNFSTNLSIIIAIAIISAAISILVAHKISHRMASLFSKFNYRTISIITLLLVTAVNLFVTNLLGIIVLITSTALGILVINSGIRRINMMACLLVPTIFIYVS